MKCSNKKFQMTVSWEVGEEREERGHRYIPRCQHSFVSGPGAAYLSIQLLTHVTSRSYQIQTRIVLSFSVRLVFPRPFLS